MRAALLYGPGDLRIEEVETPTPCGHEVLVRVRCIGICPSDVRVYEGVYKRKMGSYGKDSFGLFGHEWSGEVVEIGDSVEDFSVGDRVVPEIIIPCGTCRPCRRGLTNLCVNKVNVTRGYAEFAKAPSKNLLRIPENVSFEEAAFSEPIAVCLHANEVASIRPGDFVLVIGGGPMGLLNMQISKLSGASVIVSEVVEERLEVARRMGADMAVNPAKESLSERVKEATGGYGADAVIVATGNKAAIESAFEAVGPAGTVVLFGGTYPPAKAEFDPNLVHYGEVRVAGSYDHLPVHMEKALRLLSARLIDVKNLISHTFGLEQLKEGFELVRSGRALKVLIRP